MLWCRNQSLLAVRQRVEHTAPASLFAQRSGQLGPTGLPQRKDEVYDARSCPLIGPFGERMLRVASQQCLYLFITQIIESREQLMRLE